MRNILEQYLDERETPGPLVGEKFVTVMCTDLKDSAAIAENEGVTVSRMLVESQRDLLLPVIAANHGVLMLVSGDGSLSYFANALDAVRAAAHIQQAMDALNMAKKFSFPVLMRIGLHSGPCRVQASYIDGAELNFAYKLKSVCHSGSILMSEATHKSLADQTEINCRFEKQLTLQGKPEPCNAYKAFWNPREIELEQKGVTKVPQQEATVPLKTFGFKPMGSFAALIGLVLILTLAAKFFSPAQPEEDKRSIHDSVIPAKTSGIQRE
ncbi:MAG: adenylate/guanylate cyclase domain-containing protein [Nitrosomonadales bacterium]|nr:adenylate/guanylate cyclase domain-containing protein [Nitrosomonadales bacterium]